VEDYQLKMNYCKLTRMLTVFYPPTIGRLPSTVAPPPTTLISVFARRTATTRLSPAMCGVYLINNYINKMNKQQTTRIAIAITISSIIAIGFVIAYFAQTIMYLDKLSKL